jgi:hypothetical protein
VLAHEDAAELLQRALAALERRGARAARRGELACQVGEALARAGLHPRSASPPRQLAVRTTFLFPSISRWTPPPAA